MKNHWNATLRRRLLLDAWLPGETTCLRNYMRTLDLGDTGCRRGSTYSKSGDNMEDAMPECCDPAYYVEHNDVSRCIQTWPLRI